MANEASENMEAVPFDVADLMDLADEGAPPQSREEEPEADEEVVQEEELDEDDSEEEDDEVDEDDDEGEGEDEDDEGVTGVTKKDLAEMMQGFKDEILSLKQELAEAKGDKGEAEKEPEFQAIEFVDSDGFNNALSDQESFNKTLNDVYQAGQQAVLQQLPSLISKQVAKQVAENELVRDFYRSNPDLAKVRPLVTEVAQEVGQEMGPGANTKKFLTELAKRTRDRMKASSSNGKKRGKSLDTYKGKNPGAVKSGGSRRGSGRPGKKGDPTISDEIASMMNL